MKKEYIKIMEILGEKFKDAKIALNYNNEYQLMIAVILSAQCTDKRVNIVTEELFKRIKTPEDMVDISLEELKEYIKSVSFFNMKAKNLKLNAKMLIEKYKGEIPKTIKELTELPGVGRKTANVLLSDLYNISEGIVVDTHVRRLSNLIGFVNCDDVFKIEQELMKKFDKKYWYSLSHYLILHGRDKCIARRPKCNECEINKYCKYFKEKKGGK